MKAKKSVKDVIVIEQPWNKVNKKILVKIHRV